MSSSQQRDFPQPPTETPSGTTANEQNPNQPPAQQQFRRLTAEEMRALRECGRESFYYRSLPFAAAGAFGVYYARKLGYLKPSPTYGMYMKYFAAVAIGYFAGKFSYLGKCREKLINLPNSELAEALRRRQGGGKRQLEVFQEMVNLPELGGGGGSTSGGGDSGGYAPMREGSDMYTSPDFSGSSSSAKQQQHPSSPQDQQPRKPSGGATTTSYDELRRQNREEYLRQQFGVGEQQQQQQQSQSQSQSQSPSYEEQQRKARFSYGPPSTQTPPKQSTTKYGDVDFK